MPFLAFLWLIGVGKTNVMSGNRTIPPFLGEHSDRFWLGDGFNWKLILKLRGALMRCTLMAACKCKQESITLQ